MARALAEHAYDGSRRQGQRRLACIDALKEEGCPGCR
jgi:hypothetical protein